MNLHQFLKEGNVINKGDLIYWPLQIPAGRGDGIEWRKGKYHGKGIGDLYEVMVVCGDIYSLKQFHPIMLKLKSYGKSNLES